jgi:hypothetical protein
VNQTIRICDDRSQREFHWERKLIEREMEREEEARGYLVYPKIEMNDFKQYLKWIPDSRVAFIQDINDLIQEKASENMEKMNVLDMLFFMVQLQKEKIKQIEKE